MSMDKKKFRAYFQAKEAQRSENNDVVVTGVFSSACNVATTADLVMAEAELKKTVEKGTSYETSVPSKIQTEVAKYASSFGTKGALIHFKTKYLKFKFKHSTINTWKKSLLAVVVMNKSCINESVDRIFSMMK